jgi:hypothetical protein
MKRIAPATLEDKDSRDKDANTFSMPKINKIINIVGLAGDVFLLTAIVALEL